MLQFQFGKVRERSGNHQSNYIYNQQLSW